VYGLFIAFVPFLFQQNKATGLVKLEELSKQVCGCRESTVGREALRGLEEPQY
jgi:hypothetical protein